jgi:hypothetical protein
MDEILGGYVNANCRGQRIFKFGSPMQKLDKPEAAREWVASGEATGKKR